MPRTVWLPAGAPADAVSLLCRRAEEGLARRAEWKEYITRTVQTGHFLAGDEFKAFIANDEKSSREVFEREGWIVK